jgi:hypothetical protein
MGQCRDLNFFILLEEKELREDIVGGETHK